MRQQFTQSWIPHTKWIQDTDVVPWPPYNGDKYAGKITEECATTDYDGTLGMADATVEAIAPSAGYVKKIIIKPPVGTPAIALRFRTDGSAGDDNVIQLYTECGIDHYQHLAELTLMQGTQLYSGSIYFDDGVTPTATEKHYSTVTELTGTDDFIGGYVFNLHGADKVLILCNDLDTTTQYVDWRVIP